MATHRCRELRTKCCKAPVFHRLGIGAVQFEDRTDLFLEWEGFPHCGGCDAWCPLLELAPAIVSAGRPPPEPAAPASHVRAVPEPPAPLRLGVVLPAAAGGRRVRRAAGSGRS